MLNYVSRNIELLFFSRFQLSFAVLVSSVVTILSILSQKLLRMVQRYLRARAMARREEVVAMQDMNNEE